MGSDGGLKLKAPVAMRADVRHIFRLVGCRKTPASWCSRPAPNPIASFVRVSQELLQKSTSLELLQKNTSLERANKMPEFRAVRTRAGIVYHESFLGELKGGGVHAGGLKLTRVILPRSKRGGLGGMVFVFWMVI